MRRLILYFILSLTTTLILGQTNDQIIVPDSCSPNFIEVYDFQVGDVFQYDSINYGSGGIPYEVNTTIKYIIIKKVIKGDTVIYSRKGIKHSDYSCTLYWNPSCDIPSKSEFFQDSIQYIDSTNHVLNKCQGQLDSTYLLNYLGPLGISKYGSPYFITGVQIQMEDTNYVKLIGGQYNLFIRYKSENDSLIQPTEFYEEIWAKNLGTTSMEFDGFEGGTYEYLIGYIKNGDTTGTITSDKDLIITDIKIPVEDAFTVYPNPTNGKVFIKTNESPVENIRVEIFDVLGYKIAGQIVNHGTLDLSGLNKGIYFLKFILNDRIIPRKVLLE